MVIIGRSSYPLNSGTEVGQAFLKVSNLPDFITRRGPYVRGVNGVGIEVISFSNSITPKWQKQ